MTKGITYTALAAAVAFAWSYPAIAAPQTNMSNGTHTRSSQTQTSTQSEQSSTKMSDAQFAKKAAEGGEAEVKLGHLAEQKASNPKVKEFGQRMVTDHTKANDQLSSAATKDNISVPTTLDKKDQQTYDRLSKLSGSEFDRAYARDQVKDHEKDIAEFRSEAENGQSSGIREFASQTLPTLQEHLSLAKQMEASVGQGKPNRGSGYPGNPGQPGDPPASHGNGGYGPSGSTGTTGGGGR